MIVSAAFCSASCSFNVGTGGSSAGATPSAASSTPAAPTNSPTSAATATKSPDAPKPGSDDLNSETEQIKFAKGTNEATLDRTIAPGINKMYLFTAKKGQYIYLEVTEETGKLEVDFNKQRIRLSDNFQYQLNVSGEWAIYVNNPTQNTLKYKLFLGID